MLQIIFQSKNRIVCIFLFNLYMEKIQSFDHLELAIDSYFEFPYDVVQKGVIFLVVGLDGQYMCQDNMVEMLLPRNRLKFLYFAFILYMERCL